MANDEPPRLTIDVSSGPDGVRLGVRGDVDLATVDSLVGRGTAAVRQDSARNGGALPTLTIDFGEVEFCDSAGINGLVRLRRHSEQANWGFRLINPRPHIRRVLVDFMGMGEFLNVGDSPSPR